MAFRFYNGADAIRWCEQNIGPKGSGWNWTLTQADSPHPTLKYKPTLVEVTIDDPEKRIAFSCGRAFYPDDVPVVTDEPSVTEEDMEPPLPPGMAP